MFKNKKVLLMFLVFLFLIGVTLVALSNTAKEVNSEVTYEIEMRIGEYIALSPHNRNKLYFSGVVNDKFCFIKQTIEGDGSNPIFLYIDQGNELVFYDQNRNRKILEVKTIEENSTIGSIIMS